MREIRLSGSEGGGTGNSTGPPYPYPPRPCSSERAVPAMGDRHGLWYPEQGRTPERPGLRSHAGAWER